MSAPARLILLFLLLLGLPAQAQQAGALRPEPGTTPRDAAAAGALVWLHPFARDLPAPDAPDIASRFTAAGYDLWRFDRAGGPDPLAGGAARLAEGTQALRARGYRRVILLGESRGAFVALVALRNPGLADGAIFVAPAAHGRSEARRPQALADFAEALAAAAPGMRLALFLFRDDPWDPDPAVRARLFREAAARLGAASLLVDQPEAPIGHGGLGDPMFDARFGACLLGFITAAPDAAACP
jgi:hypothetical protein